MPPLKDKISIPYEHGLRATSFQTSVSMPTYLSCFIVTDFESLNTTTRHGKTFRVYAKPSQIENAKIALDSGRDIQDYYETFFNMSYPLPKTDLIAIPDFLSGAMENWGLITFRESSLLFNPIYDSADTKDTMTSTVAHELAHQWFGNLVTMAWWDDLWLNEGFATYMEYLGTTHVRQDWHKDENILVEELHPAMIADANINSHPIIQPVRHPDEITELFDSVTYSKGSSVLRMLHHFMGDEDFRKGLQNYLRKFSYGNARTEDLWAELTKASTKKLDIGSIMDTWTKQMGFPIIHISRHPEDATKFTARQERYLLNKEDSQKVNTSDSPFGYLWKVPLTYRHPNGTVLTYWLQEEQGTFEIPWAQAEHGVIKFNVDQQGFYKVNYQEPMWNAIIDILMKYPGNFSRTEQAQLLDDAFTLSAVGYLNYSLALNLSKYLIIEKYYYLPWAAMKNNFQNLAMLLIDDDYYSYFKKHIINVCTPIYFWFGWTDWGDHLMSLARPILMNLMCFSDHTHCLQEAQRRLQLWMTGKPILKDLRKTIYRYGISSSNGSTEWTYMWNKYLAADSAGEKKDLLYGLAFTKQVDLLTRYLEYAKNESLVKSQDFLTVLNYISSNPLGRSIVWDFVREEWPYLVDRFTLNDRNLGKMVASITKSFSTERRLQEIVDFFHKYPDAGAGTRARKQALENVQSNINWQKRYKNDVKQWLEQNVDL